MTMKESMKQEALSRMLKLGLRGDTITKFRENGELTCSMNATPNSLTDSQLKRVKEFEEKTGFMVYHIIDSHTEIGEMLSLLYISTAYDEWPLDWEDLESNTPLVYVANLSYEYFSEFGSIGIETVNGSLVRTA